MADFDAAGEDNLVIHDGFTYRDLDVDEKTSCKVSTKEAYIHLLKQHGALVPCAWRYFEGLCAARFQWRHVVSQGMYYVMQ